MVRAACAVFGADDASVRLGGRAPPECSARAVAIATGCDALAATVSEMTRATGSASPLPWLRDCGDDG